VICGDLGGGEKARRSGQITSTAILFLTKAQSGTGTPPGISLRQILTKTKNKFDILELESQLWIDADEIPHHSSPFWKTESYALSQIFLSRRDIHSVQTNQECQISHLFSKRDSK
jgi:hypothetical protein